MTPAQDFPVTAPSLRQLTVPGPHCSAVILASGQVRYYEGMTMVRQTRQRAAVIEVLQTSRAHPDAAQVLAQVREKLPSVSLGTVYRTLDALVRDGVIMTIERTGQATRYDYKWADEHHHHAVCRACGAIYDVPAAQLPNIPASALPAGFQVTDSHLEFIGVCAACAEKNKA